MFNLLTKVYQPTRGTVLLDGVDTHNMNTVQVNKAGIARTFQNIRLFNNLSVEDNVKIGMHNSIHCGLFSGILRLPRYWKEEKTAHERALELLSIFHMQDLAGAKAGSLPYGAQRRLEIIRALGTNPSLLLLDEPAAGMNPSETAELMENIVKIRDTFQIAILLIEHDMNLVMGICEGICVLNFGQIIAKGTPHGNSEQPGGHQGLPGRRKGGLRDGCDAGCQEHQRLLRRHSRRQGHLLSGQRGGDCHPHRRQRRGQDYHTANRVRSAPHPHRLH